MASVRLEAVRKVYADRAGQAAVQDASFEVRDGEFVVLVGPSGCGKSTMLRMIAGLEAISAGRLFIGERLVNDLPPKDRDIAMVFQSYALYPHMSVYDNLAFGLKLRKIPRASVDERVRRVAASLELDAVLERRPGQLSGGQRQRVALGRAIVREPRVFLFDEPLSNLDAKLRVQMRREIQALHARLGATMIYVTHDQVEAMTMGERIVVLDRGRIQQIDTPMRLYHRPVNRFVAGFIGSPGMSFVEGALEGDDGVRFRARDAAFTLPLAADDAGRLARRVGQPIVLGLRPEALHLVTDPADAAARAPLPCTVELAEPMGNEIFLHLRAGPHPLTARIPPREVPAPGTSLTAHVELERMHFFDAASGEAV